MCSCISAIFVAPQTWCYKKMLRNYGFPSISSCVPQSIHQHLQPPLPLPYCLGLFKCNIAFGSILVAKGNNFCDFIFTGLRFLSKKGIYSYRKEFAPKVNGRVTSPKCNIAFGSILVAKGSNFCDFIFTGLRFLSKKGIYSYRKEFAPKVNGRVTSPKCNIAFGSILVAKGSNFCDFIFTGLRFLSKKGIYSYRKEFAPKVNGRVTSPKCNIAFGSILVAKGSNFCDFIFTGLRFLSKKGIYSYRKEFAPKVNGRVTSPKCNIAFGSILVAKGSNFCDFIFTGLRFLSKKGIYSYRKEFAPKVNGRVTSPKCNIAFGSILVAKGNNFCDFIFTGLRFLSKKGIYSYRKEFAPKVNGRVTSPKCNIAFGSILVAKGSNFCDFIFTGLRFLSKKGIYSYRKEFAPKVNGRVASPKGTY